MSPALERIAIALLALCFALSAPAVAMAKPDRGGAAAGDRPGRGDGGLAGGDGAVELGGDDSARGVGTVNPLVVENPVCAERIARRQRQNCRVTGTPEGRYPTSNYGFEIHIDTGLDNIVGNFQALLAHIANSIWQALLFVLSLILTLLGWAFELSPFTNNETVGEISAGLERFYRAFTSPWLVVAIVVIGAIGIWRGLVRREVAATIAGTLLSLLLIVGALIVIHDPRGTVGRVAEVSNEAAQGVIAAPQRGSLADPTATYAEATDEVWQAMTLPGFAALNFSNLEWALSAPDVALLEKANETACLDFAYLNSLSPQRLEALAEAPGEVECSDVAALAPAPSTNAEIWLRSSPGAAARDSLWDEFNDDAPYNSYFAIQGDAGAWTRLPLVLLIGLGLLGGICLLAWLALRIFVQTAVAFVLVLSAPLALFLPAFGEAGRRAFGFWGATLAGALVSKLVYAGLLSVVLFATTVIGSLVRGGGGVGATMGFLVMSGLWWAVFLKRDELVSFISVSPDGSEGGSGRLGSLGGAYAATRIGRAMLAPLSSTASGAGGAAVGAARGGFVGQRADRAEGARRVAEGQLDRRAEARLDARLGQEQTIAAEQSTRRGRLSELSAQRSGAFKAARRAESAALAAPEGAARTRQLRARAKALRRADSLRIPERELRSEVRVAEPRARAARSFTERADERERAAGSRWSEGDLAEAREALRREADRPISSGAHAWRVAMAPEHYEGLRGRERETAQGSVGEQLRADRAALGAIPDRPEGLPRPQQTRQFRSELVRHRGSEARRTLADAGRAARDERRGAQRIRVRRLASRRGVSR